MGFVVSLKFDVHLFDEYQTYEGSIKDILVIRLPGLRVLIQIQSSEEPYQIRKLPYPYRPLAHLNCH